MTKSTFFPEKRILTNGMWGHLEWSEQLPVFSLENGEPLCNHWRPSLVLYRPLYLYNLAVQMTTCKTLGPTTCDATFSSISFPSHCIFFDFLMCFYFSRFSFDFWLSYASIFSSNKIIPYTGKSPKPNIIHVQLYIYAKNMYALVCLPQNRCLRYLPCIFTCSMPYRLFTRCISFAGCWQT